MTMSPELETKLQTRVTDLIHTWIRPAHTPDRKSAERLFGLGPDFSIEDVLRAHTQHVTALDECKAQALCLTTLETHPCIWDQIRCRMDSMCDVLSQ